MIQYLVDIWTIFPELIIAITALLLLVVGVFQGEKNTETITFISVLALIVASLVTIVEPETSSVSGFSGFLMQNSFTKFMKLLVFLATAIVLLATHRQLEKDEMNRFEYPVLMLMSSLGMSLMLSASDFLMFFIGVELQALPVYILVAMRRNQAIVSESALKYFILGSIASVFILYGISFIYGFVGTTEFNELTIGLYGRPHLSIPLILGLIFIISGIAFKTSIVPFHMWTPDVYEGSPTGITLFIASAPKVAAIAFMIRMLYGPLMSYVEVWQPLILALSAISMILGVFAALFQTNIKRLLAYSAIANMGYVFLGVGCVSLEGVQSVVVYLFVYLLMTIGIFACLLNLRRRGIMPESIDDLKGLSKVHPTMALALAVLMFSLAGIPPLAGFFAKILIFMAAVDAGLYALVVLAVLSTVIGAAYYLKIVKAMYFDQPVGGETELPYDKNVSKETSWIIAGTVVVNVFFLLLPSPVVDQAEISSTVLFERR